MSINGDSSLPNGWALPRISEITSVNPRMWDAEVEGASDPISFVPMAAVEAGSGRLNPSSTLPANQLKPGYTRFQEGDVLFAKITPCMENGKCAIAFGLAGGKGAGSTEFHVLRPTKAVHPKLLLHFLLQESFRAEARANMKGAAGQLRVPPEYLSQAQIPLAPFAEQERIIAEIEKQITRLDAAVAGLKRVRANLKRYRASVLKAACEGRLVPTEAELAWACERDYEPAEQMLARILKERRAKWEVDQLAKMKAQRKTPKDDNWKAKYHDPATPNINVLPSLPKGWCWASLESIADALGGYAFKSGNFVEHGQHQVVKMANIKMGKFDPAQRPSFISDVDPEVFSKYSLQENDILVTLTGTRKKRDYGYVVVIKNQHASFLLNQRIARLRPYRDVLSAYMEIAMQSESYRDRFFAYETGNVGQGNVGMAALTVEPIALAPIAEQSRIVSEVERRLSVVEEIETTINVNLKRAERLRQSILKRAFEGKLVPQDPSEEPASVLLERIKEKRERKKEEEKQVRATRQKKTQPKLGFHQAEETTSDSVQQSAKS